MSKKLTQTLSLIAIFAFTAPSILGQNGYTEQTPVKAARGKVKRVINGDAIELEGGVKVRYIGIDTPETGRSKRGEEPYGKEAFEYNKKLVQGREVLLLFDVQQRDKYGWFLAYVFVDSLFVNAELVRYGYAVALTHSSNIKYQELFLNLEKKARGKNLGLWELLSDEEKQKIDSQRAIPEDKSEISVFVTLTGQNYHTEDCKYLFSSKVQTSLKDAKLSYSPCKDCNPPQ